MNQFTNLAENNIPTIPSNHDYVRRRAKKEMEEQCLSQGETAQLAGVSTATLSQFLNKKYSGDNEVVSSKVERWLDKNESAFSKAKPIKIPFVQTPTQIALEKTFGLIARNNLMGIVTGVPGVGKTLGLKRFIADNEDCWFVCMSEASGAIQPALTKIADGVGITNPPAKIYALEKAICEKVEESYGCLFIDESNSLRRSSLEAIRYIFDQTTIGLCLVGNPQAYVRLFGGVKSSAFSQLTSRISLRKNILKPERGDVTAILDSAKIKGKKERDFLHGIAMQPGALREMSAVIELASEMAVGAGNPLDITYFKLAYKFKTGE